MQFCNQNKTCASPLPEDEKNTAEFITTINKIYHYLRGEHLCTIGFIITKPTSTLAVAICIVPTIHKRLQHL